MNPAAATILVITLSTHGHWFGGREGEITLEWSAAATPAVLNWHVMHGRLELGRGAVEMPGEDGRSTLRLELPQVRARTTLQWRYVLRHEETGQALEQGARLIHVYPNKMLENFQESAKASLAIVAEPDDPLARLLRGADATHTRLDRFETLRLGTVDRVVIGEGVLDERPGDGAAVLALAQRGANVLVLEQRRVDQIAGLPLRTRSGVEQLRWRLDHPLFHAFEPEELASLLDAEDRVRAVALPADGRSREVAFWPNEATGAAPVEALLVTRRVGKGRVVLCQLPIASWQDDPRTQRLLMNALDYLAAPVAPTPSHAERHAPARRLKPDDRQGVEP